MKFILFIYFTTKRMKTNLRSILLYVVRFFELLISGAAGGALGSSL